MLSLIKLILPAVGSFVALLAAVVFMLIVHKIITNMLSLRQFIKQSKGMPMFDNHNLIGNHIISLGLAKDNCRHAMEVHQEKGPYVGALLGDKFVMSTTDLDLIKRIVLDEMHLDRPQILLPMREFTESIMFVPANKWKQQRRVFGPALSSNKFKMPNVLAEIEQSTSKLIGHIERELEKENQKHETFLDKHKLATHKFDADDLANKYSLDLVFSCFYKQNNLINFDNPKDKWAGLINLMIYSIARNPFARLSIIFPPLRHLVDWLMWHLHKVGHCRQMIMKFVKIQTKLAMEVRRQQTAAGLAARQTTTTTTTTGDSNSGSQVSGVSDVNQQSKSSENFIMNDGTEFKRNMSDYVIDAFLDGKLTRKEYFNSSCFVFAAAVKTTADCISFTLYLLSTHPEYQERLRKSIQLYGVDSDYLTWVLNESLRLLPPTPIGCTRTVSHSIELANGKYVLPANTEVFTNAYVIHRLKQYWGDDAQKFKPERWADTSGHHPLQFIPFGAGPRGCPGREFAFFHMKSLFVALMTRYKFEGHSRTDAHQIHAPIFIVVIQNSSTFVAIKRLD